MGHILAIDQGTTSSRAIVFDAAMTIVASAQEEFPQHDPASGHVEHDPADIWSTVAATCREARTDIHGRDRSAAQPIELQTMSLISS